MARNALATTARAVKATAGQWLVLFFLTFVLACPAISMAADAAATAPAAQTNVVTVADAQDTAVTPSPVAATTGDVQTAQVVDNHPWWFWPVALLFFCFILGIIAVMAGVGGGVLFVPLVSGFFPFHLDFVRGAGLLVALAGALGEHCPPACLEELGFLPSGMGRRVRAVGNSSLDGAALLAAEPWRLPALARWCAAATLVPVAEDPGFHADYLRHMRFGV